MRMERFPVCKILLDARISAWRSSADLGLLLVGMADISELN